MERLTVAIAGLAIILLAVGIWLTDGMVPRTTGAFAVVSECGVYAVMELRTDGSLRHYGAENQLDEAAKARIRELAPEARLSIAVPCPGAQL